MRRVRMPSFSSGYGVGHHGEVHEVGLCLLDEALSFRALDGRETP